MNADLARAGRLFGWGLLLLLPLALPAQGGGMTFFQGTWQEALEAARTQRKPVFVDAYTVWCGPCKAMARNTFPDGEVGAFFNANFINYQLDMEKGEGVAFAQRYDVIAYPTLLFINHQGEVIHKALGYRDPGQFIAEGRKAVSPDRNFELLKLEVEAGTQDPEILYHYALGLKERKADYRPVANRYFATQTDKALLKDGRNWKAIEAFTTSLNSREFQYLLAKQRKFMKRYGIQPVADKIYAVCKQAVLEAALSRSESKYQAALQVALNEIDDEGQMANRLRMVYAEGTRDWGDYAQKALYHYETYRVPHPRELDHSARIFYEHVTQPEMLEKALSWTQQAIALENAAYTHETRALLLDKLGRREEALKEANVALRLAILNEEPTDALERLVKRLRQ